MQVKKTQEKPTKERKIVPKHHRGQNFLIDKNIVGKIAESASLSPTDIVIEVGPGQGALTTQLALRCKHLIAIEVDKDLIPVLEKELEPFKNITVIHGDIRRLTISDILKQAKLPTKTPYKIVANIPYYLTGMLIRTFLETTARPTSLTLLIQKEVAERIIAKPGDMSLLALSVQYFAETKILFKVSKNCFWPKPKVESAVIQITPKSEKELLSKKPQELFFKLIHAGFSSKRKYLSSNLSKGLKLSADKIKSIFEEAKISEKVRAEELSVEQWLQVAELL